MFLRSSVLVAQAYHCNEHIKVALERICPGRQVFVYTSLLIVKTLFKAFYTVAILNTLIIPTERACVQCWPGLPYQQCNISARAMHTQHSFNTLLRWAKVLLALCQGGGESGQWTRSANHRPRFRRGQCAGVQQKQTIGWGQPMRTLELC